MQLLARRVNFIPALRAASHIEIEIFPRQTRWKGSPASSKHCQDRCYSIPTYSKARILVVEDDDIVRLTISKLLSDVGYDVSSATDGFDALMHLQETVPDLMLSDLNMPQMSGFELLSVVRRRFPEMLVVASSGAYDSSEIPSGVIADGFYAKGQESSSQLLDIISRLLRTGAANHKGENTPVWIPRNGKDHNGSNLSEL